MLTKATLLRLFMVTSFLKLTIAAQMTFTKVKCKSLDKNCADFSEYHLRVVKSDLNEISLHIKLLQLPVVNVTVRLSNFYIFKTYITNKI